jgi:hypothetical protein
MTTMSLFHAELVRFRRWTLALSIVHLLTLGFMTRVADLGQLSSDVYRAAGGLYLLVGLLFGLYQMGSYRRPSLWLNLLHRPLSPRRIAAELLGATAVLLAVAIALPLLAIAAWQDITTHRVVDTRHWLVALGGLQLALAGYLAGAFCMLAPRRYGFSALALLPLLFFSEATGLNGLLVQALLIAWLCALVLIAFKPDLDAPPETAAATVATAAPIQMATYLALVLGGFGAQMVWIAVGTHPNNMEVPPPGGHNEIEKMDTRSRMIAGLRTSASPQAAVWREQIALSETIGLYQTVYDVPQRGALMNAAELQFGDSERRVHWTFSHDRMRFVGIGAHGREAGEFGIGAADAPFDEPAIPQAPLPVLEPGDTFLFAGDRLLHYESRTGHATPRLRLPNRETIVGLRSIGESIGVLSDRALYVIDGRDVADSDEVLVPRQRVALPGASGDLGRFELIELADGYLVSLVFSYRAHTPEGVAPYQQILHVDDAGVTTSVARRDLAFDFPAVFRYQLWWPSPLLHAMATRAPMLGARPDSLGTTQPAPIPPGIWWLAGITALLSVAAGFWRMRRLAFSAPAKAAWIAVCALFGIPGLVSLWLLYPPDDLPEVAAVPDAAYA